MFRWNNIFSKGPTVCQGRFYQFHWVSTVCLRGSDPFFIVSYCIKWVKTSWTNRVQKLDYLISGIFRTTKLGLPVHVWKPVIPRTSGYVAQRYHTLTGYWSCTAHCWSNDISIEFKALSYNILAVFVSKNWNGQGKYFFVTNSNI